jgi:hypothetical protein
MPQTVLRRGQRVVYALAVVPHAQPQLLSVVADFYANRSRIGVPEGIAQRFAPICRSRRDQRIQIPWFRPSAIDASAASSAACVAESRGLCRTSNEASDRLVRVGIPSLLPKGRTPCARSRHDE